MLLVAAGVLVARAYPTDPDVESPCGFDVVNGADTGFKYEYGVEEFYEGAMAGNFPGFTYGHPPCQQMCTGNRMGELRDDSHDNYMRTANGYQITDILDESDIFGISDTMTNPCLSNAVMNENFLYDRGNHSK